MAQICGIQNHNRMTSIIPLSHVSDNKFTTEEGIEFMLHELEPDSGNYDSGSSSRASMKKRGRPRKDVVKEMENCQQSTFNFKESEISEEKLRKKREKRERKERKEREKLRKLCFEDSNDSTPKKRGRPRKIKMLESTSMPSSDRLIDYHTSSNTDTLTPPYSELTEESVTGECSMMEMLNLDQELLPANEEEQVLGISESFDLNYNWSPIQRLMQLNQALAFTNMYKDFIFWDRIIAEFMLPSVTVRLEFGTEKSFDLPFLVVSKLFWIFSQIGLHRVHFLHTGITEKLSERDDGGGILFNSSDAFIYTHLYNDESLMIQHRTSQLIEFDPKSKISKWTIRFIKCEEFWKSAEDKTNVEEFIWGFPKRVFEYLDVALVMNSVLPDPSSWLTWFYTYIHQNGLKNFSVVELSRPPSPFKFPLLKDEVMKLSDDNLGNMEFFDNGRDFIFSVLNSTSIENINFDGAVNDLLAESDKHQDIIKTTDSPFEELFEKETEELLYPEFSEYPDFKEEQVIPVVSIEPFNHCEIELGYNLTSTTENEVEEMFEIPEREPEPEVHDEQLIVEISDTETNIKETESDSDDFFDSYN